MCTLYVGRFISSTSDLLNSVEDYINIVFLDKICSLIYYLNGLIFSDKKNKFTRKSKHIVHFKNFITPYFNLRQISNFNILLLPKYM